MADKDTNVLTFILGKETISGTKSTSSVYKNPTARVEVYNKKFIINVPKGIIKLILKVPFEYEEASLKKDIPNFLFILYLNNKKFARTSWLDKDIFYKFDSYSSELTIEIDLEKFYSDESEIELNFSAHLECWLEESSWKSNTPTKTVASASGDADLEINLPKVRFPGAEPELYLEIFPTHSPGTDLKTVDVNTDWGNTLFFNLWLDNKTNNAIGVGEFGLVEADTKIKSANLGAPLRPKNKTIIISETRKSGAATWILTKAKKDWNWYKKSGNKFEIKKKNQIYKYYVNATQIIDEFGFSWKDLKTEEFLVNVRVPDYKINAMNAYNLAVDLKTAGEILAALLGGEASLVVGPEILLSGAAGILYSLGASTLTDKEAEEVKTELKNIINDPLILDRNYKIIFSPKLNYKQASHTYKNKLIKAHLLAVRNFVAFSNAARITNNRSFSAQLNKNYTCAKKQTFAAKKYKKQMLLNLNKLSKIYILLGMEIGQLPRKIKNKNLSKILINLAKLHKKFGLQLNILRGSLK